MREVTSLVVVSYLVHYKNLKYFKPVFIRISLTMYRIYPFYFSKMLAKGSKPSVSKIN